MKLRVIPAEPSDIDLDRESDQVGVAASIHLLLEKRGRIGHRLVGDIERVRDFRDFSPLRQQPDDFQLPFI